MMINQMSDNQVTEAELYKELGKLTKEKKRWKESISYVSSLLTDDSAKIQAKALWLLAEMGLEYPDSVKESVLQIAFFLQKRRGDFTGESA